jgi:hypothetical protein
VAWARQPVGGRQGYGIRYAQEETARASAMAPSRSFSRAPRRARKCSAGFSASARPNVSHTDDRPGGMGFRRFRAREPGGGPQRSVRTLTSLRNGDRRSQITKRRSKSPELATNDDGRVFPFTEELQGGQGTERGERPVAAKAQQDLPVAVSSKGEENQAVRKIVQQCVQRNRIVGSYSARLAMHIRSESDRARRQ